MNNDPISLIPLRRRRSARHDFFLVARTGGASLPADRPDSVHNEIVDKQGALVGQVIIVPKPKSKNPRHGEMLELINDSFFRNTDGDELIAKLPEKSGAVIEFAASQKTPIAVLNFALFRTGELRIWAIDEAFMFPLDAGENIADVSEFAEALAEQVYYFIKEAAHLHYHHKPEDDQLLPLTKNDPAMSVAENEVAWRRETLWGLARIATQYRRRQYHKDHADALGVLAYADAFQQFQSTSRRTGRLGFDGAFEPCSEIAKYDFTHTRASVTVTEAMSVEAESARVQKTNMGVATGLSLVAIYLAILGLLLSTCPSGPSEQACQTKFIDEALLEVFKTIVTSPAILGLTFLLFLYWSHYGRKNQDFWLRIGGPNLGQYAARLSKAVGASCASLAAGIKIPDSVSDKFGRLVAFLCAIAITAVLFGLFAVGATGEAQRWVAILTSTLTQLLT